MSGNIIYVFDKAKVSLLASYYTPIEDIQEAFDDFIACTDYVQFDKVDFEDLNSCIIQDKNANQYYIEICYVDELTQVYCRGK